MAKKNHTPTNLGLKLERIMIQQGLTQESLAKKMNPPVTQNAIYKITSGQTKKPRCLPDIAKALGVTMESLLDPVDTGTIVIPETSRRQAYVKRYVDGLDPNSPRVKNLYDYVQAIKELGD